MNDCFSELQGGIMSISNEEAEERSWSNLQVELLDLIMRLLSLFDQLSVRAVCKSWRSAMANRLPNPLPWNVVFDDMDEYSWSSCKLLNFGTNETYTIDMSYIRKKNKNIKDPFSMRVHQSKCGWLMISSYHKKMFSTSRSLYLFTPFRNRNNFIELPTWRRSKSFEFAAFSTDPLRKDCLFLTAKLVHKNNSLSIKTCRRGDHFWSTQNFKCDPSTSMIAAWTYSEGILCYLDRKVRVWALDITRQTRPGSTVLPKIPNNLSENGCRYYVDMVKLDGVLFVYVGGYLKDGLYGIDLRLDHSLMTWKEIIVRDQYGSFPGLSRKPSISLFLGESGDYRSAVKYREDGQVEKMYDIPRALLGDNSPFLISVISCTSRQHVSSGEEPVLFDVYWIDHPFT